MKKEIIIKILEGLDESSILLNNEELGITEDQYAEILDIMIKTSLISGVTAKRAGPAGKYIVVHQHPQIELNGIEYLKHSNKTNNWTYKVDEIYCPSNESGVTIEELLNKNGTDGWELVNVIPRYESVTESSIGANYDVTQQTLSGFRIISYTCILKKLT